MYLFSPPIHLKITFIIKKSSNKFFLSKYYVCSTSEAISPGMFPPAPQTDIYLIRRRATLTIEFKLALLGGWRPPDWQSTFGLVSEGAVKKSCYNFTNFFKRKNNYYDKRKFNL